MSATAAVSSREVHRQPPPRSAPGVRSFVLGTIALDVSILTAGVVASRQSFVDAGWGLIAWTVVVAAIGIASVPFESGQALGLDMPVLLSVGYLFGPFVAGSVAFIAYVDARELRREISLARALFNRAQTSLSVMAATAVFAAIAGGAGEWPLAAVAALAAVGTDCLVNYGTVVAVLCLNERIGFKQGLSRLYFGTLPEFAITYASFGLLSLVLAEIYKSVGPWSLAAFAMPLLLARQAFSGRRDLETATRRVQGQANALRDVSSTIADERRDERLALAAGLHDEVLPPLYKVHLMGQVLRQDLATGRLLALEEDLPELLQATDAANESMRELIGSLRKSPLGAGGLKETLRLLIEYLERESSVRISFECDQVGGAPFVQLLMYQVAREALRNSLRHSRATAVSVILTQDDDDLRLIVADNGVGFHEDTIDLQRHFGLVLMRERVELAGGILQIDSVPGSGTQIVARLPGAEMKK